MTLPNPPEIHGPLGSWLRKAAHSMRSQRLRSGPGYSLHPSPGGTSLVVLPGGGAIGWHWAEPKEYDQTTNYGIDEVVQVSPDNDAVVIGVETSPGVPENATAGTWVCIKTPTYQDDPGGPFIHIPRFPYTSVIYWKLISFYPIEIEVCEEINGVKTVRHAYANITPSFDPNA